MKKQTLKPSWSKIIVSWLLMASVILVCILIFNFQEITDMLVFAVSGVVVLFQTFVFSAIFYNLPFFKIEVTDSHVTGLRSLMSWERVQIPVGDVDTQNVNKSFQWLGYYVLKSKTGQKILVCGFDEKQFGKLIGLIHAKQAVI